MSQAHPPRIFISYSHKDSRLREQLEVFLARLKQQNVEIWSDTALKPGVEWDSKIRHQLSTADIILLLISPDFLASKYIIEKELQQVMERHENGEAAVIPIFLRPCDWKGEVFDKLQGLPSNGKPVTRWSSRDVPFTEIAEKIREIVNDRESKWVTHIGKVETELPELPTPAKTALSSWKYPTWPYARQINEFDCTPEAPATCVFQNRLYAFWRANDTGCGIYCTASTDGESWPNGDKINTIDSTPLAPAACVFNGKLHVFWRANNPGCRIYCSASANGAARFWPNGQMINDLDSTLFAPACCTFNNKLYVFWVANDPGRRIYCSASTDGVSWPNGHRINDVDSTPMTPAVCVFNNKLYVFWRASDPGHAIYYSASADGVSWPNGTKINQVDATLEPPTACAFDDKLYLLWKANDPSNYIYCSGSTDGVTWPSAHQLNDFDSTPKAQSACTFNGRLFVLWKANDPGNRIYVLNRLAQTIESTFQA